MLAGLSTWIAKKWPWVILFWTLAVVVVVTTAPRWDDVTYDGDLAYMPASMSSVRGEALLETAFPNGRSKSEMAVVLSRDTPLAPEDLAVADRLAARFVNLQAVSIWKRELGTDAASQIDEDQANRLQALWGTALELDDEYAAAFHNRAILMERLGRTEDAANDRLLASDYDKTLSQSPQQLSPTMADPMPIIDVWHRHTEVFGSKLRSRDQQATLIVVRLSQEFMATDNIRVLDYVESILSDIRQDANFPAGLQVALTGSATVGGDMLRSSAESIKNTELYTVILVVSILVLVYRSPVLVAVPLVTIGVSLVIAMGVVAAMTQVHLLPGFDWWNFKVFTTTRIFVVVILFGAGTDFCLFLIARFREELNHGHDRNESVARALHGVGEALIASALTTIVGLSMMFFADFGKFRNSGPAIGLCLAITLLACLTLAPALLSGLGRAVFWPWGRQALADQSAESPGLWHTMAERIVRFPGMVLMVCIGAMVPFALLGWNVDVTYDFLSELSPNRTSKIGAEQMRRHYPIGETGPLIVLAQTAGHPIDSDEGKKSLWELTEKLQTQERVSAVRSLVNPAGDGKGFSLRAMALMSHHAIRSLYLGEGDHLDGDVVRLEVILADDPFSIEATRTLSDIDHLLMEETKRPDSFWSNAEFVFSGTTAAIRDLRTVTSADNIRIQVLVVLAVLAILLIILRRPIICLYLILSVLFSYYVTMGLTELFFKQLYGATFEGLDWKVPLFLFVILVAVGQDYNIYLTTRVFEEQAKHGLFGGLKRAIVRTGGIITSCGVIMAGTFVSMTSGSLRGIVELGFALSLGVILDTFVVRPILVPAFLALLFRYSASPWKLQNRIAPGKNLATSEH